MAKNKDRAALDTSAGNGTSGFEFHATADAEQWPASVIAAGGVSLRQRMASDSAFRDLIKQGLTDLDDGRVSPL